MSPRPPARACAVADKPPLNVDPAVSTQSTASIHEDELSPTGSRPAIERDGVRVSAELQAIPIRTIYRVARP